MSATDQSPWRERHDPDVTREAVARFIPSQSQNHVFFPDRSVDQLMQVVISLGAEHWVMRRRMLVIEALLEQGKPVSTAEIERFNPSPEQQASWSQERDAFIRRAFDALQSDGDMGEVARQDGRVQ